MLNSLVLNVSWLSICSAYLFVYNRFLSLFFLNISWLNESMTMRWLCGWEDVKISYCLFLLFKTKFLLFLKILILTNLTDCSTDSIFNQGLFYCFLFTTITTTIPVSAVRLQHATCKWGCVLLQNCGPDLYLLGVSCFERSWLFRELCTRFLFTWCFTVCGWLYPELCARFLFTWWLVFHPLWSLCPEMWAIFLFTWWLMFHPLWWLCPEM